jgi:hypothetical protein
MTSPGDWNLATQPARLANWGGAVVPLPRGCARQASAAVPSSPVTTPLMGSKARRRIQLHNLVLPTLVSSPCSRADKTRLRAVQRPTRTRPDV